MSNPCLTATEKKRAEDYNRITEEQIRRDQEYAERGNGKGLNPLQDLLKALEAEALEQIRDVIADIGILQKCKEAFPSPLTVANTDVVIWMLRYKVEENQNDILRWRSIGQTGRL